MFSQHLIPPHNRVQLCVAGRVHGGRSFIARKLDSLSILFPETHEKTHLASTPTSLPCAMAEQTNDTPAMEAKTLEIAQEAVMVKSVPVPEGTT